MLRRAAVMLVVVFASPAFAQPPTGEVQRAAIKKLDFWVGTWKGTAKAFFGEQSRESTLTETVQSKVGGTALLVEGLGKMTAEGQERVVHNAMAVVSWDEKSKTYRFKHYTMQGRSGESELKTVEGGFVWELREEGSPVVIRFTIKIDGKTWHEVGEMTRDGKSWQKVIEFSLEKQGK